MSQIDDFKAWLQGKPGFHMLSDNSPNSIQFRMQHHTGTTHKQMMNELMKYQLWIKPLTGKNKHQKTYLLSLTRP